MKSFKNSVVAALAVSAFTLSGAHAASWQDSLNSAASQLSGSNAQASGGMSVSSLTSLLNGSSQSLTAPGVGKRADSCYNISSISIFLLNGRES